MTRDLTKLYELLTPDERRRGLVVVAAMVLAAALQALAAGSLYPFLAVVSEPTALDSGWLNRVQSTLGLGDATQFLVVAGIAVLFLVIAANAALAYSHWARLRFQWGVNHTLSVRLLKSYLGREYAYFLTENTSELHRNILTEATEVTDRLLRPVLSMLSNGSLAIAMVGLLVIVDPMATLLILSVMGGGYTVAYGFIRRRLRTLGERYSEASRQRYQTTAEAFGGIKHLKVAGREGHFLSAFEPASRTFTRSLASRKVYATLPKYVIEALAMGSLLGVLVLLLLTGQPVSRIVPIMGTFVYAGYRMTPAFRDMLGSMASFRFTEEIFESIQDALEAPERRPPVAERGSPVDPLQFEREITLEEVTYRYPGANRSALREVSMVIRRGTAVAIVGETGAGKTTIVDVLLGLIRPTRGRLIVDGVPVTEVNVHRWRANIGYVPQEIYLADTTVRRNIAYGLSQEEIDDEGVRRAARIAQVHDFIAGQLEAGYETVIGERGVRLSGGERQRIGIARALYHDPPVLVLDEATSEIDGATEARITRAIAESRRARTVIMVAHRMETIRHCDVFYSVSDGEITAREPDDPPTAVDHQHAVSGPVARDG